MSTLLLDTDVFSFLFKDHPLAEAYRPHVKGHTLAISFMTVAELYQGAYRAGWGAKQIERLESRIAAYVVIPSSHAISKRWGEVRFIRRAQPISPEDACMGCSGGSPTGLSARNSQRQRLSKHSWAEHYH